MACLPVCLLLAPSACSCWGWLQGFDVLTQHLPVDVVGDCNVVVENLGDYLKEQGI